MIPYRHYLIFLCFSSLLLVNGCASSSATHDAWFSQDKGAHFTVAAMIGTSTCAVVRHHYEMSKAASTGIGFASALGMGAFKEWYDLRVKQTYWSWKDFFWDALGGMVGSFVGAQIP